MFDSHVHFEFLDEEQLMNMSMAGINNIVTAQYYPNEGHTITSPKIEDHYERLFKYERTRAIRNRINLYYALGINMVCVPQDYEVLLDKLPTFIEENSNVVALGEIGIDPKSSTLPNLDKQEELFINQMIIAKEHNLSIICHTPHLEEQKIFYTKKLLKLADEYDFPLSKMIIDHASAATVEIIVNSGAWAGITVQPWRKFTAFDAVDIILKQGVEKILVNSDSASRFKDPLAVPKTAFLLRNEGFNQSMIDKLFKQNPREAYNIKNS